MKRFKYLLIILVVLTILKEFSLSLSGQSWWVVADTGVDSLFKVKNYNLAINEINLNYNRTPRQYEDEYYFHQRLKAICYLKLDKIDTALYFLKQVIEKSRFDEIDMLYDNDILLLKDYPEKWEQIENLLLEKYLKQNHPKNIDLATKLFYLNITDQEIRQQIHDINDREKYKYRIDSLQKICLITDSVNLIKLEKLIKKYRWPTYKKAGIDGAHTAFYIIQHSTLEKQKQYFKMIQKAAQYGEASKKNVAYLEDRIRLQEGKKQKYGTQLRFNKETKKYEAEPLEFPEKVDSLRKSVGLKSLEEYIKNSNTIYY